MLISAIEARVRFEKEVQRLKDKEIERQKLEHKRNIEFQLRRFEEAIEEAIMGGDHIVTVALTETLMPEVAQILTEKKYNFEDLGHQSHTRMNMGCNTTYWSFDVRVEW